MSECMKIREIKQQEFDFIWDITPEAERFSPTLEGAKETMWDWDAAELLVVKR